MLPLFLVNRLKTIMSLVLATAWLASSSHAFLEHCELIHHAHADHAHESNASHESNSDNHDPADGKCALSSTHVSVPIPKTDVIPFLFCLSVLDVTSELQVAREPSGLAPPGTAPPQFSHRWQFSFRTALPARAPSFAS